MGMVFLITFVIYNAFNFELCVDSQYFFVFALCLPSLTILILLAFFMETNRPPFDLSEAESDVVAGYNVEYAGILFGLFYLGEYLNLFAACVLLVLLFCGG
jgi:NADH-quinone oxidoreductase subunit H